jgi:hypothetical protein
MSSMAPPSSELSSRIDEQLRLRIAEDLSGSFKGEIIGPDHPDYERARLIWNAMVDRRPGLILRCTSTRDVVGSACSCWSRCGWTTPTTRRAPRRSAA